MTLRSTKCWPCKEEVLTFPSVAEIKIQPLRFLVEIREMVNR